MLPTPSTSHVNFEKVYEPSEDSYLLLDTLASDSESKFLASTLLERRQTGGSPLIVEVGTGSGVILAFVTAHARKIFGTANVITSGTDVNPFACREGLHTVEKACRESSVEECGFCLGVIQADLASAFKPSSVDVLIFNPPYVPSTSVPALATKQEERESRSAHADLLALSYEGGIDGLEVTNRLLAELPTLLNRQSGVAYVLLCQQNQPEKVMKRLSVENSTWNIKIVGRSGNQAGWEKLCIVRVSHLAETD